MQILHIALLLELSFRKLAPKKIDHLLLNT